MTPQKDSVDKLFSVSELAAEFEVSARSIRFYEEKGLIMPDRTAGNQRVYNERDRTRLILILRGKRFGYSLEEISEMIGMTEPDVNEIDRIEASLVYGDQKLEEIKGRMEDLRLLERDLLGIKDKLKKRLKQLRSEQ